MPTYTIQGPSGKTYTIDGPEGASADQLGQFILSQSRDERVALQSAKDREAYSPAKGMGVGEKFAAGAGKVLADMGQGVAQYGAGIADFFSPRQQGLSDLVTGKKPMSRVDEARQAVAETRQRDAALMDTTAGRLGNIAGNVALLAPTAMIPGANTYTGAATIGAITGAMQPTTSGGETMANIGLGAAGGAGGKWLGDKAGAYVADKLKAGQAAQQANAQKVAAAQAAAKEGYVIPPADLPNQGALTEAVSGLSGKIKTAQTASAKNQQVTNGLVRRELGLDDAVPLNLDTLKGIRSQAGQAYEAVASTGTITPSKAYGEALDKIVAPFKKASEGFPNAKPSPVLAEIDSLRSPQFDAASAVAKIKELRGAADSAYAQGNKDLGKALKDGALALENAIDEHLTTIGAPADLLKGFRDARQTIAKTYTVQKALNAETGDVNAQVLARELAKDRPLSGNIRKVAEAAQSFPKATQALKEAPKALSPLDFGAAGIGLAGSGGNPLAALGLVARPAARNALLSAPVQASAIKAAGGVPQANILARLLQNEPAALPVGVLTGNSLASYLAQ